MFGWVPGTRPNISESHSEISTRVPFCIAIAGPPSKWNKAVAPLRAAVQANAAPSFMGGIHPRFKHEVGRRLALAYGGALSPTIAGCTLAPGGGSIELELTVAEADRAMLQWSPQDYNMSTWGTLGARMRNTRGVSSFHDFKNYK